MTNQQGKLLLSILTNTGIALKYCLFIIILFFSAKETAAQNKYANPLENPLYTAQQIHILGRLYYEDLLVNLQKGTPYEITKDSRMVKLDSILTDLYDKGQYGQADTGAQAILIFIEYIWGKRSVRYQAAYINWFLIKAARLRNELVHKFAQSAYAMADGYDSYNEATDLLELMEKYKRKIVHDMLFADSTSSEEYRILSLETMKSAFLSSTIFAQKHQNKTYSSTILNYLYSDALFFKGLLLKTSTEMHKVSNKNNDINNANQPTPYFVEGLDIDSLMQEIWKAAANIDWEPLLKKGMEEKFLDLYELMSDTNQSLFMNVNDMRAGLRNDEAAIEIIRLPYYNGNQWTDTIYYAALILTQQTQAPILVLIENGKDLEDLWYPHYYNWVRGKGNPEQNPSTYYSKFWEPIRDSIPASIKKIYLSMDGIYHQINIESLLNPSTGQYVLDEDLEINYLVNSLDIINRRRIISSPLPDKEFVLIGAPTNLQRNTFPFFEALEIATITGLCKEHGFLVNDIVESRATEATIKALQSPYVLHIASHGFSVSEKEVKDAIANGERELHSQNILDLYINPSLRSGVILADNIQPGSTDSLSTGTITRKLNDGVLTAHEAANLQLEGTELVVLSACQTGQGIVISGEGVYGLQRAFMIAGAQSLIASWRDVSSSITQEFMSRFYRLWLGGMSKRQAFTHAQRYLKNNGYSNVKDWGAFVFLGE